MVDPANVEQANKHKDEGNGFLKAKKFHEAVEAYSKAISLNPLNHVFYSNRSAALLSLGKAEKALEDATECVNIKPDWAKGYGRRGAALYALERFDDAIKAYDEGLGLDASNKQLASGKAQAEKAHVQRSAAANPFATLGAQLSASPKFRQWMEEDPQFKAKVDLLEKTGVSGLQTMVQMGMQGGGMDEKTGALLEAIGLKVGDGEGAAGGGAGKSAAERAREEEEAKKRREAEEEERKRKEEAEREAAMSPEERAELQRKRDAAAKKEEGVALYKQRKLEEAFAKFQEARDLDPTDTLFLLNQASVRVEQGKPEEALTICEEAIKHAGENGASFAVTAKCLARKGGAYMKMGEFEKAAAAFDDSLTESDDRKVRIRFKEAKRLAKEAAAKAYIDPEKAAEAKERGNALFKEKKFAEAIEEYTEAIKRDPDSATYYHNRAQAYLKVVRPQQARDDAQRAIDRDPKYVRAHARLGYAHMQLKEYHKAIKAFSTGLEYDEANKECKQGFMDAERAIQSGMMASGAGGDPDADKERMARAMQDPEIQGIVSDPLVGMALQRLQQGPEQAAEVLKDPSMAAKIQKLIAAGVLRMGEQPAAGGGM